MLCVIPSEPAGRPQRPRLPQRYHCSTLRRCTGSRPGSGWDRVGPVRSRPRAPRKLQIATIMSYYRFHDTTALTTTNTTPKKRILHQSLGPLGSSLLPAVHRWPIYPVVSWGSLATEVAGMSRLEERFPLRCLQRFARPNVATQLCCCHNNWITSGPSTPVLSY